jgi:hypothetical protein
MGGPPQNDVQVLLAETNIGHAATKIKPAFGCGGARPDGWFRHQRKPMTPNQVAYRAVQARRSLPHGQRPTDLHVRIMFLLARWQNACPSHGALARAARCHRNSVLNALHRLRDLGLLAWERQTQVIHGWRLQTANRYLFVGNLASPPTRAASTKKGRKQSSLIGTQTLCSDGRPLLPVRTVEEQIAFCLAGQ